MVCGFSSTSRITSANSVPLDLREREKDVFVGQQRVLAAARFFDRAVDDALGGFANLARRDIEVVYVHVAPPSDCERSKTYASTVRRRDERPHNGSRPCGGTARRAGQRLDG